MSKAILGPVLVLCLASTAQAQTTLPRALSYSLATVQLTDAVTTTAVIYSGAGRELNPRMAGLVTHPLPFALVKASAYITTDLILFELAKTHPTLARVMGWTLVGAYTAASIQNARQVGRVR